MLQEGTSMGSTANSVENGNSTLVLNESNRNSKMGGVFILGLTAVTAVVAGVFTARFTTKKSQKYFPKQIKQQSTVTLENPYVLAFKALGLATVWAVGGVSLLTFGACLCLDIRSLEDLRTKIRKHRGPVDDSTNFETFQDLFNYIVEESKKPKSKSKDLESKS